MRHNRDNLVRGLFVLAAALSPVCASHAALDKFEPYAYTRVLHDTNIFRLSGDQQAISVLGDTDRDDTIVYLGAGVKADLKLSRQHLLLDLDVRNANYDSFGDLDHTQVRGTAAWRWQVGNLWSGDLGYRYEKALSSFNQFLTPTKDLRTTRTGYFEAGYDIHPDWRLLAGVELSDTSYEERNRLDRDTNATQLEIQYKNTLNTRVGVRGKFTKYDLARDSIISGTPVSNNYEEAEISAVFYWQGTGKSSLEANLGYTDLNYDDLDDRDFQGSTGRLTYFWVMSGKTKLEVSAWRETSSLYNEVTTYVLSKGISLHPVWSVTRKISLSAEVSFTNEDFEGDNNVRIALGQERRDDDLFLYRISAGWQPQKNIRASIGYQREERDSSIDTRDFDGQQYDMNVSIKF